jgi:tetratricopeptide (TPR) repeat protein
MISVARATFCVLLLVSFVLALPGLADEIRKGGFASAVGEFYRLRSIEKSEPRKLWKSTLDDAVKATAAGDNKTAEAMFRKALKIARDNQLPPAKSILALDGLSNLCLKAHRCSEAEAFLKSKLMLLPSDSSLYAGQLVPTTLALGLTYRCLNKKELAIKQFRLVLDLEQKSRVTRYSRIAAFRLAESYQSVGDQKRQEVTCRWFLQVLNQPETQDDVMFWTCRMLGDICLGKREFKEAERLFEQCLQMPADTKGLSFKDQIAILRLLGDCYLLQGRLVEAEDCYRKGLARAGSRKDLIELSCGLQLGLADVLTATQKYEESELLYKKALADLSVLPGQNDRVLAEQMQRYAKLLKVTGRKREYDNLQQKRLKMLRRAALNSGKR